jgi:hypothetical protein
VVWGYNQAVLRLWCLAVLVCLSLWGAASGAPQHASDSPHGATLNVSVLADTPSSDDTSDRHWHAARSAACPTGSTWASQGHHAVLARAACHSIARVSRPGDASAAPAPRTLRPQFNTPLLI